MRSPIILCCFILLLQVDTFFAQNYRCFNTKRIAFFEVDWKEIFAIRIDSIQTSEGDTTLYSFYDLQPVEGMYYDCYTPLEASWIGKKIIIKDGGLHVFINKRNDSIFIKTLADTGEWWNCYSRDSSFVINAEVLSVDTVSFLGITDSVKTIAFRAIYSDDSTKQHPVNNLKIRLSKSNGLISTLNFNSFPDIEYEDPRYGPNFSVREYNLAGITKPDIGINNLTWLEVNDYAVGDEYHTILISSYYQINPPYDYYLNEKTIKRIISRFDKEDTVCYQIETIRQRTYSFGGKIEVTVYQYTENPCYTSDPYFDKLPREPFYFNSYGLDFSRMLYKPPPAKYFGTCSGYYWGYDNCWHESIYDGCFPEYEYTKGLGLTYYECSGGVQGYSTDKYSIVYYKKGNIQWGIPIFISSINRINARPSCIYPNPFSDFVTVNLLDGDHLPCSIRIYDLNGRMIHAQILMQGYFHQLDLSHLGAGFYIYTINAKHKLIDHGKLVKR